MEKFDNNNSFKFSQVYVLFIVIVLSCTFLIFLNGFTIKILSACRAYVNGESHYSKAQKDAVRHLITYLYTQDTRQWDLYMKEIKVPLGDGIARVGLSTNASVDIIKKGFIQGRNSNKDLDDLIWLFRNFSSVSFLGKAIEEWEQGDYLINELTIIGHKVDDKINTQNLSNEDRQRLLLEISNLSEKLTVNQRNFSNTLGEGTHVLKKYLMYTNIFFILLIVTSVSVYYHITIKKIIRSNHEIEIKNEDLIVVNKELDQFVYSASHDLRAPITSLKGLVVLAKEEDNIDDIKRYVALMDQSLVKQDEFITEIIDYFRNKRITLRNEYIDLNAVIDEVVLQYKELIAINEIQIYKDLAIAAIKSDPIRIKIILNNLLSNAIKYSDKDKTLKFIRIRTLIFNTFFKIEIEDNGIGIKEEFKDKIFDMFFVTNSNLGSGLGLYITKEAVDKLNGSITVNSKITKGTIFTVIIPLNNEE